MTVPVGALGGIGNTPLISLQRMVPPGSARVLVKLEWANPTGSMKDRMARAAVQAAAADGRLAPGDTVVEYTAGTTGISLAFVCAALGYRLHVAFSDAFSEEKRRTMQAFGATITDVPSDGGRITAALIKAMIATSQELAAQPGHWWCDQLNNHDAVDGYVPMGEEIWQQSDGASTPSSTRWARRTPSMVSAGPSAGTGPTSRSPRWSPRSRRSCPVAPPARTASRASASDSCHPSGGRTWWMGSSW